MKDTTEAILDEFDEKFPSVESWSQRSGDYTETPLPVLKSFLKTALERVREEERKNLIEILDDNRGETLWATKIDNQIAQQTLTDFIRAVKEALTTP